MRTRLWFFLVLTVLVGCGEPQGPLTEAELISAGDEVCSKSNARLIELRETEEGVALEETDRAAIAIERLNEPGLDTTRALAALQPPPELVEPYARLVELRRERDSGLQASAEALRAGEPGKAGNLQTEVIELSEGRLRARAEKIGFEVCGQPLPPREREPLGRDADPAPADR
ncbi:MAG: hypothetical protein H0U42_04500 [Thermoleophilaceae bacterium]|nr:hypothetical protein [Thermoleophilaceae bacterium]